MSVSVRPVWCLCTWCLLCCVRWKGWSEDLPTGKNCTSERTRLGIVAGFNPPECKGEPPPGARAFVITLVPAPSKFKQQPRNATSTLTPHTPQIHSSEYERHTTALHYKSPSKHTSHTIRRQARPQTITLNTLHSPRQHWKLQQLQQITLKHYSHALVVSGTYRNSIWLTCQLDQTDSRLATEISANRVFFISFLSMHSLRHTWPCVTISTHTRTHADKL